MHSETFKIKNFKISSLNDFLKAIIKDKTILEYKLFSGNDAYLLSTIYGHLEIKKYLEKEPNWNIHVKDNLGRDAYYYANNRKYIEIKKHLSELYKKEKEEKYSNLEEELKLEKEKNSKLEEKLKQIKETLKKFIS